MNLSQIVISPGAPHAGAAALVAAVWRAAILAAPVGRSPRDRRLGRGFGKMHETKFAVAAPRESGILCGVRIARLIHFTPSCGPRLLRGGLLCILTCQNSFFPMLFQLENFRDCRERMGMVYFAQSQKRSIPIGT